MMRGLALALLAALFITAPSRAQGPVIAIDMPADHIDITTGFSGSHLSIFGVRNHPGDVAIVVKGPNADMVIRRKQSTVGIWMNRDSLEFQNMPVYYDYALSLPEAQFEAQNAISDFGIGLANMEYRYTGREDADVVGRFREALVRGLQQSAHYPLEPKRIQFRGPQFFRADFYFPADVPTGVYTIYTYLFNEGELVAENRTNLRVAQIGFNARLYDFANQHGVFYGLLAVLMAIVTGWGVYTLLRRE